MPISPDMLIGRRYKLLECLGAGGMGEVWKAQDTNFTRTVVVAVKLLKEDETIADDTRNRSNFLRVMQREAAAGHLTLDLIIDALDETFNVGVNRDALRAMAASRFADGSVSLEQAVAFFDELVNDTIYNENARHRRRLRDLFATEANSVAVLQHPNIVRVTDYGEQSGLPYLVMDFISGRTLQQVIQRKEPMKLTDRLRLMEDLCEGLSYAHTKDLVHRDIKPANLIIDGDTKRLKILDFGVARTLQLNAQRSVSMGAPIGTYCYMSPEQTRAARTLDNRSDIFSVGLVFYELLSFKRAFPSTGDIGELIGRIQRDAPPPLGELVPNLDAEIDTIIHKAIEKVPAKRYQDLAEMQRDIELVRARIENEEKARSGKTADATIFARPKPVRQQVTDLVDRATSAFDTGDDHAVIEFSDQILSLMPDQPDALELKARAHTRIRQNLMEAAIADAHKLLARGEITAAGQILNRPEIDRTTTAVRQFARDLDAARWNRRIDTLLDQARRLLDAGQLNEAVEAAASVLELEAHNISAREISEQASRRLAALHQEQVAAAMNQADLAARDDRLEDAIRILSPFAGEHEVDVRLAALEQERAERLRRETATRDALARARDRVARDDFARALDAVTDAQALSPANEEAAKLFAQLTAIVPALTALDEAIARFGQDSIASADERLGNAASTLNTFVDRFPSLRKRLAAAATARDAAVKREAERKQREAEAAEKARRRAAQLERERIAAAVRDATETVRAAIAKSSFDSAEQALASLAQLPESDDAVRMVTAELTRARQQAIDKSARQHRDAARQLARRGQLEEALAMLEAFVPAHAVVAAEIKTVRDAITERDEKLARQREAERLRLEEERARAAEAERARLELERRVDEALAAGDSLVAAGKRAQGIQLLAEFTPQHPRVEERLRALRTEQERLEQEAAAAEERKRAAEALRARQELERRVDETIALSDALFAAGDYTQALNRLARFEPPHPRVQDRLSALRTEKERIEEVARKEKQRQEEAARQEKLRQEEAARAEKQRLEDEARKEQQRQEEAARAAAEQARAAEAERQRLALEARVNEAIASADTLFTAGSHAEAIKLLDTFDVTHPRVQTHRDKLRKELKHLQEEARKEQQRQEEAARAAAERARAAEAERERLALEARANDAIAAADALFTAGSYVEAIQLLDAFEPRHARVQTRRDTLRQEHQRLQEEARKEQQRQEEAARAAEAERLRLQEERERKQREAEEAARAAAERERIEAEIKDLLARATKAEAASDYRSALELATAVSRLDSSNVEAIRLKSNLITALRGAFQKNKTDSALRETLALYDPWFFRRRLAIRAAAVAAVLVLTTTVITRLPWSRSETDPSPAAPSAVTEPAPTPAPTAVPPTTVAPVPEPPPPAPPPDMASLTVDLRPWARVRIVPADTSVTVPADAELTPFTVTLPPGEYILRAENGGLTNAFEVRVQLEPGKPSTVSRELPGFNPDTIIEKLLGQR